MEVVDFDNAKSRLQEYCQQRSIPLPVYNLLEKAGPDHCPTFQVEVEVNGMRFVGDWASKKRDAEKLAAFEAWISIHQPPSPPNNIYHRETKDPSVLFESLNLVQEEKYIEPMDCD